MFDNLVFKNQGNGYKKHTLDFNLPTKSETPIVHLLAKIKSILKLIWLNTYVIKVKPLLVNCDAKLGYTLIADMHCIVFYMSI